MKKYFLLILVVSLVSCQTKQAENPVNREIVPNPEKLEHDNYNSEKITFVPDSTINMISLLSDKNVETYLGKDVMNKFDKNLDIPALLILNSMKTQCLKIYFHPGGIKNKFSEFEVFPMTDKIGRNIIAVKDDTFKSESGIILGMTLGDFKAIKGEPDTIIMNGDDMLYHFEIESVEKSEFLKKYNMPLYYADYNFKNGYLFSFKFGFQYP